MIVTHNMQQAARVSDRTAFFTVDAERTRIGRLVEFDDTEKVFTNPSDPRTEAYVTGKVGCDATRSHFQEELEGLERAALGGLDLVVEALDRALETVQHQDVELASMVIADDDRIDGRYLEVHQGILSLLALQAPVAGDLRLVAALLHVIKHVERMGDQCVNMAKLVPLAGHEPPAEQRMLDLIQRMGEQARQQVLQCGQAFERRDVEHGAGPRAPGRRDRPAQPRRVPPRARAR